ncbi:MAG: heme exporter protein CcmD [Porticoccaceae bacterium]|nr:heme exporter protein CcmD [Pseudomonadales bacterium]MCP5171996.1 heme exporter protein CcmD [Pseudomonadales bacterium]
MKFQFESLSDFLQMSGHGPYVWMAYGVGAAVMIWLIVRPVVRRREVLRNIARDYKRQQLSPEE